MGDKLYVEYWQGLLPQIIEKFRQGQVLVQLQVLDLIRYGDRQSYSTSFRIERGELIPSSGGGAQGRDLFAVLSSDPFFEENLSDKIIQVTITKDLNLKMELLSPSQPNFFTEEDFELLQKYASTAKDSSNQDHEETYGSLKSTYLKTEYWAREVQKKAFPQGSIQTTKRPTNRAGYFETYHWSKIYPDKVSASTGNLAFTVSIDTDEQFIIKIDTVGLNGGEQKDVYDKIRGEFHNSPIVKIFPCEDILPKGWNHLIDFSVEIVQHLKPEFDKIFSLLNTTTATLKIPVERHQYPLNTILYGPPGTGKTFRTFSRAVEIANPSFQKDSSSEEIKAEYQRLMQEGQIRFVTFHQNYSYEDFIIGVRPDLDGDDMKFVRHEGIFFTICKETLRNYRDSHAGRNYIEPSFEEVLDKFLEPLILEDEPVLLTTTTGVQFKIVRRNPKNLTLEKSTGNTSHTLSINTIKQIYASGEKYKQGLAPYYNPLVDRLKGLVQDMRTEVGKIPLKNYVLIIDEINRANISRVFGELITLLEDDKRVGADYELKVMLPNGEEFSVPPNLYVLGTMNTADKSIALLDIALRRRFVFEDFYPTEEMVDRLIPAPFNQFLKRLNREIGARKGADFMIGHAYFMPGKDRPFNIERIMNEKVIPLLNEYFYSQRDNPVYKLLKALEQDLGGAVVEEDGFIGTKVKHKQ